MEVFVTENGKPFVEELISMHFCDVIVLNTDIRKSFAAFEPTWIYQVDKRKHEAL